MIVGTVTNNAWRVAEGIANGLRDRGAVAVAEDAGLVDAAILRAAGRVIVCTSTRSAGLPPYRPLRVLPEDTHALYKELVRERPDLSSVEFAVCALGDHAFDPFFCQAGKVFGEILARLGARRVAESFEIDGPPGSDEVTAAQAWAGQVLGCFSPAGTSAAPSAAERAPGA